VARILPRLSIASALTVFAFVTAGCLQTSINPLFDLSGGRFDDRLAGAWSCREAETWTFEQKQETDHDRILRYYDVVVKSGDQEGRAVALLGKIGTHDFITFTAEDEPSGVPPFLRRHYRSVFTFGRVEISANRLAIYLLDGDWVEKSSNAVARGLAQKMFDDSVLLTAPTKALQTFAAANATNDKAFPQTMVLVKAGASGATCYSD
jgi:hypothetical protein